MVVGNWSLKFQKRLISVFQKHNVAIKPAYTSIKLSDYYNNKSKCSEAFNANVIYKYTCSVDQSISYIRETSRQIFRRIADHKGTDKKNAIIEHLFDCKHCQNSDITSNFKVLKWCKKCDLYSVQYSVHFGIDADWIAEPETEHSNCFKWKSKNFKHILMVMFFVFFFTLVNFIPSI